MDLRLATYNLLHGVCLEDNTVTEARLRAAARAIDADVVALQEVDRFQERSGRLDQARIFAEELGAVSWRYVPSVLGTPGESGWRPAVDDHPGDGPSYGVGLVSRVPVEEWHVLRFAPAPIGLPLLVPGRRGLTPVPDEPRLAVAGVLRTARGPVTVAAAHLSFVPGWNITQLRRVVAWLRRLPAPRYLLGDLNLPGLLPQRVTGWRQLVRAATYPSYRPRVQFDHVLADTAQADGVGAVDVRRLAVSDHCALSVTVTVDGARPRADGAVGPALDGCTTRRHRRPSNPTAAGAGPFSGRAGTGRSRAARAGEGAPTA